MRHRVGWREFDAVLLASAGTSTKHSGFIETFDANDTGCASGARHGFVAQNRQHFSGNTRIANDPNVGIVIAKHVVGEVNPHP